MSKPTEEHARRVETAARLIGDTDPPLAVDLLEAADQLRRLERLLQRPIWSAR